MKTDTYSPRSDSLAGRMIAFFRANPDEELSLDDIAEKYDAARLSIHTLLKPSVDAGLLARDQSSGDWLYKRGPGTPAAPPAGAPTRHPSAPPLASQRARTVEVDPLSVPLEADIPVPEKARKLPADWSQLLTRMQAGHSCVLPRAKRAAVSKATKVAHEAGIGKFTMRLQDDKATFRLWRLE